MVAAFAAACNDGDLPGLISVLDPDVVLRGDGGGKAVALQHEIRDAAQIAPLMLARAQDAGPLKTVPTAVNGAPGLVIREVDGRISVLAFTVDSGLITAIDVIRNPDKLERVPDLG